MFDLAAVACGCEIAWSVELDDWNRALLEKRFPDALHRKDVTEVGGDLPSVDGMIGGFPCQDISNAGRREGISGKRSGLWGEFARLIGVYEPEWVVIENVSALKRRGLNTVLDDLHKLHYDATWDCIPAIAVGAPHLRDRIWIVATKRGTVTAPAFFPAWEHGSLPTDLPRAGVMCAEGVFYDTPRAEVGACKKAMKRGRPLWPTPNAMGGTGYKSGTNSDTWRPTLAGAVDLAPVGDPPLITAEQHRGMTPDEVRATFPTPMASDGDRGTEYVTRADREEDGTPTNEAVRNGDQIFPTPAANDHKGDVVSHLRNKHGWDGNERAQITSLAVLAKNGFEQATPEQIEQARSTPPTSGKRVESWPTPCVADATGGRRSKGKDRPDEGGLEKTVLDREVWPTPVASDALGSRRAIAHVKERPNSHHPGEREEGRENERRAGALNPDWVEWLMGMPVGWTNPDVDVPVLLDWASEYGLPRVSTDPTYRRQRLTAIGNALVWKVAVIPIREAITRA